MSLPFCYKVIEKNNLLAVHAICDTLDNAEKWIDKNLNADNFIIVFTYRGGKNDL